MYRIGTLTDSLGGVLLQGDTTPIRTTVKDSYTFLVPGRRVVVSDLGQGNNQWAIVRTLGVGTPPEASMEIGPESNLAAIIELLSSGSFWAAAWVRTIRYDLSHFRAVAPGIRGTAYATLFQIPDTYKLLVPVDRQSVLPGGSVGRSLVNLVTESAGTIVSQDQPGKVIGPGETAQDPRNYTYGPMPSGASSPGGYWRHPTAISARLPGGNMLGSDAMMSSTLAALFLGVAATQPDIPALPTSIGPSDVYGEGSADTLVSDSIVDSALSGGDPSILYLGATRVDERLTTPYSVASRRLLLELLS